MAWDRIQWGETIPFERPEALEDFRHVTVFFWDPPRSWEITTEMVNRCLGGFLSSDHSFVGVCFNK